ncbi:HPr family phosphocarrier protein [Paenibacillus hemerocallicola]|uniref:HPr family phosphocarrier protein n=1 Tax=Paenibacillus hemerocallicola TaxID=1172614 RepID=A0A5C4TFE2_9BACL|nr:HPr family phosphocarrier protein [Paenibacillus hemerocallicola]TNJ67803.1 HPr family phosphocarrier protein [Paenibacillus hemerocallicola]
MKLEWTIQVERETTVGQALELADIAAAYASDIRIGRPGSAFLDLKRLTGIVAFFLTVRAGQTVQLAVKGADALDALLRLRIYFGDVGHFEH